MATSVCRSVQTPAIKKQLECIVIDFRGAEKPEPVRKVLWLSVERCPGSTEAFRIQVSSDSDLCFLYRDDIVPAKFQTLASDWRLSRELRDDMNQFFQYKLQELIEDRQLEVKIIVPPTGNTCTLELEVPEKLATFKMGVELNLVAEKELQLYLMDAVTKLKRRNKKMEDEIVEKRRLKEENDQLKQELAASEARCKQMDVELAKKTKQINSLEMSIYDVENDKQLKEFELEELHKKYTDMSDELEHEIEQLRKEIEQKEQDAKEACDDVDVLMQEREGLIREKEEKTAEIDQLSKDLLKYDEIFLKHHAQPVSVSKAKVQELEEAIKEKDERIDQLQNKEKELIRSVEELMNRNAEMQKKTDKVQADVEKYRRALLATSASPHSPQPLSPQHFSTPMGSPNFQRLPPQVATPGLGIHMPPHVGMPLHPINRTMQTSSPLAYFPAAHRTLPNQTTPSVPFSATYSPFRPAMTETPLLDKAKKMEQENRQKMARLAVENVPPTGS